MPQGGLTNIRGGDEQSPMLQTGGPETSDGPEASLRQFCLPSFLVIAMDELLERSKFRELVFERDRGLCVNCGSPGQDAHHIIERRLWPDGGYYLNNGVTLCGRCHLLAESTELGCSLLRERAGIARVVLPQHLYHDQEYDKWGNPVLPSGQRLRGELMTDASVLKIISPSAQFCDYVKYPRTYHLPWSPGVTKDDRVMEDLSELEGGPIVVTEKMDGENTTMYRDHIHARSIDSGNHPSRDRVRAIWGRISHEIPNGWRICGENLYARHSIAYDDLPGYFLMFSIWNESNICLSWEETVIWSKLLDLPLVRVIHGPGTNLPWKERDPQRVWGVREGYVVRRADPFSYSEFRRKVGKWVRADHVQTHGHWMRQAVIPNAVKVI